MKAGRIIAMAFLAGLGLILLLWLDGRWKADAGGKLSQIPQSTSTGSAVAAANGKVVPAKPSAIPAMPRRQASGSPAPFVRARPGTGGKNDAPMADTSVRDLFKDAERLAVRDEPQNAAGEFRRISLVRTSMKYPLILLNEVIVRQGHLNEENLVSAEATVADHLLVKVQPGVSDGDLAALAAKYGATVLRKLGTTGLHIVQLPAPDLDSLPAAVAAFAEEKATLQYAEADPVVHGMLAPNDPSFAQEWGMNNSSQTGGTTDADIDAPEAWNVNTGSTAVVVAVIDSGVDYNHPDLVSNMWINPGEVAGSNGVDDDGDGYVDDIRGWDFYNDDSNPMDDHFHGTHVAGTIGAYGNNGVGVAGAAWRVKIMPLKFLAANGGGYLSDALLAIHYATRKSARVTSNSWGGGGYSQALKDVIDDAALHGVLFVAAAGNESNDNDSHPAYPASYNSSNIISVAATDHNDQLAGFSNYGATSVHIAAPGVGILSTFPTTVTPIMAANGMSANYGRISGTSMATPHVTGVAALALAQNLTLPMSQLRTMLTERGDRLTNLAGFILTAGRLNAFNVVNVNWQPSPAQLGLKQFTVSDTEGNHDGYANPGEIIRVTPTLLNTGGQTASAVSAQMVSNQSSAVVLAPASVNAGAAVPFTPLTPATPFRVQLDAGLADNTVLTFDLVIQSSGGADVHVPLSIVVTQPKLRTEVSLNFACGEMKADPVRNLVYLINKTDRRILAIDTQQGNVAAVSALDGDAGIAPPVENGSLRSGQLAISLDRTKLYVALTASKKIQVFSLPDLSPLVTLPLDFAPESLVSGINGRLCCSWFRPTCSAPRSRTSTAGRGSCRSP